MGAPWPKTTVLAAPAGEFRITDEQRRFWSFQPVKATEPPAVKDAAWNGSPIDRFILAKREAKGLTPVASADKRMLIRRATFDLTGLPPTPEEIDAFLADDSPRAFAKVVDRLLASPAYGERWGRHWLDVVRYADTAGETADFPVPQAYRYRNYVIDAFNADKPYDQFLREQIAGDLLPPGADASGSPGRAPDRHRLPRRRPPLRLRPAELPPPDHRGHHRHAGQGRPRPDRRLRPLPRPQVRSDIAGGLLRPLRHLRQHQISVPRLRGTQGAERLPEAGRTANPSTPSPRGSRTTSAIHKRGDPKNPGPEVPRRFLQILGGEPLPADARAAAGCSWPSG